MEKWISVQYKSTRVFNIHYHVGKKAQVSAGRDTLNVTVAQDYCSMWTNKGTAPVSWTVELAR